MGPAKVTLLLGMVAPPRWVVNKLSSAPSSCPGSAWRGSALAGA